MRAKVNNQNEFDYEPSNLKLTNEYYAKYEEISKILDANPKILELLHKDLKKPLKYARGKNQDGSTFKYTSDTVLRILVCQSAEGMSLREIVIRIDDGHCLRWFVRIYNGPMMDFTTLDKLKNSIRPKTWKAINEALGHYAVDTERITGEALRLDTTAVETNIHYPTDSSLLWDTYRVLGRLINQARDIDPEAAGDRRVLTKKVKKLATKITRKALKKGIAAANLRPFYGDLIRLVGGICEWSTSVASHLQTGLKKGRYAAVEGAAVESIVEDLLHYYELGHRVMAQTSRRVLDGAQVPNEEKIFSIFEPHTELLKRGKAGKPIEFGHMIQIQQVPQKFITDYKVFEKKPVEHELLEPAVDRHKKLFGDYPESVAADKGYWENKEAIKNLEEKVPVVSVAKKGIARTKKSSAR